MAKAKNHISPQKNNAFNWFWQRIKRTQSLGTILSTGIAVLGLILSLQANLKSEEANRIAQEANAMSQESNKLAQEANTISQESNKIQILNAKSEIVGYLGPESSMVIVHGCKSGTADPFGLLAEADFYITLANNGAKSASVVKAELKGDDYWNIYPYVSGEYQQLPVALDAEYKQQWHFIVTRKEFFKTQEETKTLLRSYDLTYKYLTINLSLDNGENIEWKAPFWYSIGSIEREFDRGCDEVESQIFSDDLSRDKK
jgi:hypothetical protein